MELSSMGANHKEVQMKAFSERDPSLTFDCETGGLKLLVQRADGMGKQGQYDYTVMLSAKDLKAIIVCLAKQRSAFEPSKLQTLLEESSHSLLRLLVASSLLPFQLALTEEQLKLKALKEKFAAKKDG
ncbi:hypothetical protein [Gallionella capsiferriformans]|uniref:Uncharacterized protein n=1 Tax=Gallionella capsiferriformans (strain ES-2) TaxID=395494 RepID=D9SGT3_GALCS|nr:hypothetical protein [Gallionella capsiferriformans]ADL55730.1 hypothetical protein Galf_1719 [Gallionella capsiferriformans ES-2]